MSHHRSDDEFTIPVHLHQRAVGRDTARGVHRHPVVAAGGQPRRLPGRIDAAHLHHHGGDTGQAQHQYHHQGGDAQRRLDRAGTGASR